MGCRVAKTFNEILKFNPYHDSLGRFATAGGASSFTIRTKDPKKQYLADLSIARAKEQHATALQTETKQKEDALHPKTLAGVSRGKEMSFEEANEGRTNPNYSKGGRYTVNCQTCVIANEARRRGYDVTARPRDTVQADAIAKNQRLAWIDPKTGTHPDYMKGSTEITTAKKAKQYLDDNLKVGERYTMGFAWKGRRNTGHIINAFKDTDGNVKFYDPQNGKQMSGNEVDMYLDRIKYQKTFNGTKHTMGLRILRIDDKQFNASMVNKILMKGE